MEITQLHYFKTVAKYESFTKASQELHVTQSALSHSIAQLEDDIGFSLFERRRGGRITINKDGRFFLAQVVQILSTLENTVSAVREMAGLERGVIYIATSESVFLNTVIYDFLLDYPNVQLNCCLQSPEQMKSSLDDGTLNFVVCRTRLAEAGLTWKPIYEDQMTVMLPRSHSLAGRTGIYLHELSEEPFIVCNLGYDMSSEAVDLCRMAGFEPRVVYKGNSQDLAGMLVSAGLGVLLTPNSISQSLRAFTPAVPGEEMPEKHLNVVCVPLLDDFAKSEIGIVMKSGQFQSEAARSLNERIVEYYSHLDAI